MIASASCMMLENIARRLEDGAKGNTGEAKTNEVGVGAGRRVLAAGNVLLALLVDEVLDGDTDDGDLEVELGALVEETEARSTGARADQVAEGTAEDAGVDVGGVTGVDGLVAARELCLVTTLGLSLLDSQVLRDWEANVGVALVADTVATTSATGGRSSRGKSVGGGSEAEDKSGDRELHCDGLELNERRLGEFRRLKNREGKSE